MQIAFFMLKDDEVESCQPPDFLEVKTNDVFDGCFPQLDQNSKRPARYEGAPRINRCFEKVTSDRARSSVRIFVVNDEGAKDVVKKSLLKRDGGAFTGKCYCKEFLAGYQKAAGKVGGDNGGQVYLFVHWGGGSWQEYENRFSTLVHEANVTDVACFAISSRRTLPGIGLQAHPIRLPNDKDEFDDLVRHLTYDRCKDVMTDYVVDWELMREMSECDHEKQRKTLCERIKSWNQPEKKDNPVCLKNYLDIIKKRFENTAYRSDLWRIRTIGRIFPKSGAGEISDADLDGVAVLFSELIRKDGDL